MIGNTSPTQNDLAWDETFERFGLYEQIDTSGFAEITANQLKTAREPRLMAKIDHASQLPRIFKEYNLAILPTDNGTYRIGPYKIFHALGADGINAGATTKIEIPSGIETIDFANISSEPAALHAAFLSRILNNFVGEDLHLTTSGRMRSSSFNFKVDTFSGQSQDISVKSAQIEIDAGYESSSSLFVVEAKNHKSVDFNIRQLYYPYRTLIQKVKKPVKPIFFTYSGGRFELFEFEFSDPSNYSSIQCVKSQAFEFNPVEIELQQLVKVAKSQNYSAPRPKAPFPQADNFGRVINLVEILVEAPRKNSEITNYYDFDQRQTSYYLAAAKYLGLAENLKNHDGSVWMATPLAHDIFNKKIMQRDLELSALVLGIESCSRSFLQWATTGNCPTRERIVEILSDSSDSDGYSGSTIPRRASTIRGWITWVYNLTLR